MKNKENLPVEVNCPTCHAKVIWLEQSKFRPFCSERCRFIDFGEWINDGCYSIPDLDISG